MIGYRRCPEQSPTVSMSQAPSRGRACCRPARPDRVLRALLGLHPLGPDPGRGISRARPLVSGGGGDHRRARHAHLRRARGSDQRPRPRVGRPRRSARATGWRSCAATTAGSCEASVACAKLGAHAIYLNTSFAGPQVAEVVAREEPAAIIFDEEFAQVVAPAMRATRARCLHRGVAAAEPESGPGAPGHAARSSCTPARPTRCRRPPSPAARSILTSGTTGSPKGANRASPELAAAGGRAPLGHPPARAGEDGDLGAAVPLLGLCPHVPRARRSPRPSSCGAASIPRTPCARSARAARYRADRRAGDAPADPRAPPRDPRRATTRARCG